MNQSTPDPGRMTQAELKASLALAAIYFLRMLGIFMVLPVFALHAPGYEGATPLLIGLALGAYGVSQALLQIPYGVLSDRYGRKPLIVTGLLLLGVGSAVAALSTDIAWVIVGRALQGAGAISAAVMALAADLTRENQRTKAMALVGISIGLSFSAAFVVGPVLDLWLGIEGIFWVACLMALLAMGVLLAWVPTPPQARPASGGLDGSGLGLVLRDPRLLRLDAGIFCLHLVLTACFVVLPLAMRDEAGISQDHHWWLYLPALTVSIVVVLPLARIADNGDRMRPLFLGAIALLALVQFALAGLPATPWTLALLLTAFFVAFNFLEASLPALVSRAAPPERKGSALGVFTTSQFVGIAVGGVAGGWLHGRFGLHGVFFFCALAALAWMLVAADLRRRAAGERAPG